MFRELVLSKIGRLTPKWTSTIHQEVEEEWGTADRRRIDRVIAELVAQGLIERTPDGYLRSKRPQEKKALP